MSETPDNHRHQRATRAETMTGACSLPLALLAFAVAVFTPLPAAGQSDETCIAYMEADAAYLEIRRQLDTLPPGIDPEMHFAVLSILGPPKLREAASARRAT